MPLKTIVTSVDGIDYSSFVAALTERYLQLCTHYELAAMLSRVIGALLAASDEEIEDEDIMEFILTNVMEARHAFR